MFCNCSNSHNYQVVGLCTPSTSLDTKLWTEISIPELIKIPDCKPPVENIDKIFISAKVLSSKIVETPKVTDNYENLKSPGHKLIVDLELCQTIIYTADVPEQSVHALKVTIPYCAYIVLAPTGTESTDEYCVSVCIEDVTARVIDCDTIFKSVTVFLSAKPKL